MTGNHILDGECFDKAICAHLLIDIYLSHIIKLAFTEEELSDMRTFMEKVTAVKMGAKHTDPVVAVFEQRFEETFKEGATAQYSLRPYTYSTDRRLDPLAEHVCEPQ